MNTAPKLRVMQVYSTYTEFIGHLYAAYPGLLQADSRTQTRALLRSGFFAVHTLAPYLDAYNCETDIVFANSLPLQRAWIAEHGMDITWDAHWQHTCLRARIEHTRPDVLYIFSPYIFDGPFLDTLSYRPALVAGWRCASVDLGSDWSGFDVMLTSLPRIQSLATALNAKEGCLFAPAYPDWVIDKVQPVPQDTDVVFVGTLFGERRIAAVDALARGAARYGYTLGLHVSGEERFRTPAMLPYLRPQVFGLETLRALRRGRMVLDSRTPAGMCRPDGSFAFDLGGDVACSMRLIEATGGGSLVLVLEGTSPWFAWNTELVPYANPEDLVDKVRHFCAHEDERAAIAAAAQSRCLSEHIMSRRAGEFASLVRSRIGASPDAAAH